MPTDQETQKTSEHSITQVLLDWSATFLRLSMHDINRFTRASGISLAQMNVLMHLYYHGDCEVTNFCEMMQISPPGASQMVERMVQQGLVQRCETPGDRRVRLVKLTDQGRELVKESLLARIKWIEQLVSAMNEHERESIIASMNRLNELSEQLRIPPG